jgi:hypothetical protein
MTKEDPGKTLIHLLEEAEKICAGIFKENEPLLTKLGILADETKTPRDVNYSLNQCLKEMGTEASKENREQIWQLNRIKLAFRIKEWIHIAGESLKNAEKEALSAQEKEILLATYMAGVYRGVLVGIDDTIEGREFGFLKDILHTLKSKEWQDGRWKTRDSALQEAMELAEKLWLEGDDLLHHKMAKYLPEVIPGLDENVSYDVLKRELKPIAKKYNRLFGIKGVKKEKN